MSMYFITGNAGKFREARQFIPDIQQLDIDLVEVQSLDPREVIEFKLYEARKHHGGELIVEDTSIYLDGLNGFPGPLIKWMFNSLGQQGMYELCRDVHNMHAQAKTVIGYCDEKGTVSYHEGHVSGTVVLPAGDKGFGWDQIFKPDGFDKTFAEMDTDDKQRFSMRAQAFERLYAHLSATR